MLFTLSQWTHRERKRWYSLTWPTEHKEVKLKIIKGGWDKKKLVGTEK